MGVWVIDKTIKKNAKWEIQMKVWVGREGIKNNHVYMGFERRGGVGGRD